MTTPIDTTKVYSNGHKCMGSMEALGLQQLLAQERNRAEYFQANMHTMHRPRNPMTGEETPREGKGEPLLPPNWKPAVEKEYIGCTPKVGEIKERYDILGNSPTKGSKKPEISRVRPDLSTTEVVKEEIQEDMAALSAEFNQKIPSGIRLK